MTEQKGDRRYTSQPKKRSTKSCSKRQKLQLLKHKFKRALNNISLLKHQNTEDYNHLKQLMINSQRIEKITRQSQQKTKLLIGRSLQPRRKNNIPPVLEAKHTTPFQLINSTHQLTIDQANQQNKITESNYYSHPNQSIFQNRYNYRKQKQQENINPYKIQQLSIQNDKSEHHKEEFSLQKSKMSNCPQKYTPQLKNSICFRSTRLKESNISIGRKKVMKQNIRPYIMALVFSILLLMLIKL